MLKSSLLILVLRAALAATSFLINVLIIRLLIDRYGAIEYGAMSLLLAIPSLIPFVDLGMGTSLVNSTADLHRDPRDGLAKERVKAAQLVLAVMGVLVGTAGIAIGVTDTWLTLLGPAVAQASGFSAGATLISLITGMSVVTSIGIRTLQGWRKIATGLAISLMTAPVTLATAALLIGMGQPPGITAVAASSALLLTNLVYCLYISAKTPRGVRTTVRKTRVNGAALRYVLAVGSSGLVVSVSAAVLLQSDRVLISFMGTPEELAQYAVVAPLYIALWGFLTPLALNLWPLFRARLQDGQMTSRALFESAAFLGGIGGGAGLALLLGGPAISDIVSNGRVSPPFSLFAFFAGLIAIQGLQYPASMLLSSRRGFVAQRNAAIVMIPVKLTAALLLIPVLGPVGAVVASMAAVALVQLPFTYAAALRAIAGGDAWSD